MITTRQNLQPVVVGVFTKVDSHIGILETDAAHFLVKLVCCIEVARGADPSGAVRIHCLAQKIFSFDFGHFRIVDHKLRHLSQFVLVKCFGIFLCCFQIGIIPVFLVSGISRLNQLAGKRVGVLPFSFAALSIWQWSCRCRCSWRSGQFSAAVLTRKKLYRPAESNASFAASSAFCSSPLA